MTPTHTGPLPVLCANVPGEPHTETRTYFSDGTSFGARHAAPAGPDPNVQRVDAEYLLAELRQERARREILERRLNEITAAASEANRDALATIARESDADHRASDAEARLELARATAIQLAHPPVGSALDKACRAIAGRPHHEVIADLDRQVAEHPEDETHVVTVPIDQDDAAPALRATYAQVAHAIELRRVLGMGLGLAFDPLVVLADLVERLLDATSDLSDAERLDPQHLAYELCVRLDIAQRALAAAVRRPDHDITRRTP